MTKLWIDHGDYWELNAPQGDKIWLDGRVGRITTSVSCAMSGKSNFKTAEEQGLIIAGVKTEEFTEEALARMNHGTEHEAEARKWYSDHIKIPIVERGLIIPKSDYELGASVDGDIVGTDGIIEIKCPVKMYQPIKQYIEQKKSGWVPPSNYYNHIYITHFLQMQHALYVTGKKYCVYIVYSTSDKLVFTQTIPFDQKNWLEHYSVIKNNYMKYVRPHLKPGYPILPH